MKNSTVDIQHSTFPAPLPLQVEELEILTPEDRPSLAEWMQTEYHLSRKVHGLSTRWSPEYGPFWLPIIEAINDTTTREIWVYAPNQSGKSTLMTGWMGYCIDCDPAPMGLVMPREVDAHERVETQIRPMFEENPRLLRHIGGRVSNINIGKLTMFDNMAFYLLFSGSAAAMAGKAICRMGIDEAGKMEMRVGREADPINLARDRLRTFKGRSKLYGGTTPVIKGDLADTQWQKGDKCEWWVPCQHCGFWQRPLFEYIKIDRPAEHEWYDPDVYRQGGHAVYCCPNCEQQWSELDRWQAVGAGKYVPGDCKLDAHGHIEGTVQRRTVRSFRITGLILHPAIETIDDIAAKWAAAEMAWKQKDSGPRQNFINSTLAKTWVESEQRTQVEMLRPHIGRRTMGTVPRACKMLTAGVDIQTDHAWVVLIGWGYMSECWLIHAGRIETGDTRLLGNYDLLRDFGASKWPIEEKPEPTRVMRIAASAIDCGYNPDTVTDFTVANKQLNVMAVRGSDAVKTAVYRVFRLPDKETVRYDLNVTLLKDRLYRLLFEGAGAGDGASPGFMHLPADLPPDYLRQFVSEEKRMVPSSRYKQVMRWVLKTGFLHNHLWDAAVYAAFAAEIMGARLISTADVEAKKMKIVGRPVPKTRRIRTKY